VHALEAAQVEEDIVLHRGKVGVVRHVRHGVTPHAAVAVAALLPFSPCRLLASPSGRARARCPPLYISVISSQIGVEVSVGQEAEHLIAHGRVVHADIEVDGPQPLNVALTLHTSQTQHQNSSKRYTRQRWRATTQSCCDCGPHTRQGLSMQAANQWSGLQLGQATTQAAAPHAAAYLLLSLHVAYVACCGLVQAALRG